MRILVLGGTGYIGAHSALALAGAGHQVWAVARGARQGTSSAEKEAELRLGGVRIVYADLAIPGDLGARLEQDDFQVIIHGVCSFLEPDVGESLTIRAMEEALALGRRCPQLIQVINLSNNLTLAGSGRSTLATEASPCYPDTVHGRNKLYAEQLLQRSGLPWVILRICQVYGGAGSSFDWVMLDPVRRGAMPVPGMGRNRVSLVHVEDVVQAIGLVIERGVQRAIFNIASGEDSLTLGAVFDCIAAGFGVARPRRIPRPIALGYAWGAQRRAQMRRREPALIPDMVRTLSGNRAISIAAARRDLGFAPAWPDSLAGIRTAYAAVFAGQAQPFTPPGRLAVVQGGARPLSGAPATLEDRQRMFWERWASWRHGAAGQGNFADFMLLLGVQRDFARFIARHAPAGGPGSRLAVIDLGCGAASLAGPLKLALDERNLTLARYIGIDYADREWIEQRSAAEFQRHGLADQAEYLHHDLGAGLPAELPPRLAAAGSLDGLLITSSWGISYLPEDRLRALLGECADLVRSAGLPATLSINMLTAGEFDRQVLTSRLIREIVPRQLAFAWQQRAATELRTLGRALKALPRMRAFGAELKETFALLPVATLLQTLSELAFPLGEVDRSLLWGQTTCVAAAFPA